MEHAQDFWKRNPVLVIGRPIERMPELSALAHFFPSAEGVQVAGREDMLVIVHCESSQDSSEQVQLLLASGFSSDQILVLANSQENAEDLRLRLSVQMEIARQRRLEQEILAATQNGALRFLHWETSSGEANALERARLAHALGCALHLGPAKHSRSIRLALFLELSKPERMEAVKSIRHVWPVASLLEKRAALAEGPWPPEIPHELALAECAHLAVEASDPIQFRDSFREKCTKLPFRFRGELRDAVERCFAQLWKGGTRAA